MTRLQQRVIIVTGAGAGIGEAYCYALAREGARVVIATFSGDESAPHGVEMEREITREGGEAITIAIDVARSADVNAMVETVLARWGRIDGLVNNAVLQPAKAFDAYTEAEFDHMMAVNVKGPWLCSVAVYPTMRKLGKGKIVNIGSQTALYGWWNLAPYVASKGAMIGLTKALARELGPDGIRVNCLCPGLTVTNGSLIPVDESIRPGRVNAWMDEHVEGQCIKHPGYPEDLVGTLVYLMSDDSDFMTGQTLVVDGGWILH
jgi:NAD(P)-dependent dehydrogenase (short-subunit alcohol dehydrogenase family)